MRQYATPSANDSGQNDHDNSANSNPQQEKVAASGKDRQDRTRATRVGRSGPRSRLGCLTCKWRRVRCDQVHPVCGHCSRLQLDCDYEPHRQRRKHQRMNDVAPADQAQEALISLAAKGVQTDDSLAQSGGTLASNSTADLRHPWRLQDSPPVSNHAQDGMPGETSFGHFHSAGYLQSGVYATPSQCNDSLPPWDLSSAVNFVDVFSGGDTSWAQESSCTLPDIRDTPASFPPQGIQPIERGRFDSPLKFTESSAFKRLESVKSSHDRIASQAELLRVQSTPEAQTLTRSRTGPSLGSNEDPTRLFQLFRKIQQPPAAILIGGSKRWRRLQHYLCRLSDQSRAVHSSLLCFIELFMIDEITPEEDQSERCMKRILGHHALACQEIERKISKKGPIKPVTRECMLAAIFFLGWFEVIRDQDSSRSLFPRELANAVIMISAKWNRYSKQLLSWLNTLDSKATHLGREHLLAPETLHVVSYYHTEITSSLDRRTDYDDDGSDNPDQLSPDMSPGVSYSSPMESVNTPPFFSLGQVKQTILKAILQPALAWYLTSQSYCRRISAHDKHHRRRFTSDDEYEVITACKEIEIELFELWDSRPAAITMPTDQLMAVISPDIAIQLEEIFSTYVASFWILFVYLHRITWWHLPHSPLAKRALLEVWHHMQRAQGEEVDGPLRKIIHPCLMWPLFLFGSESQNQEHRTWAIEQLEALGEKRLAVPENGTNDDTLPPFKLSSGATKNAHRAAILLRELVKEQDAKQERVDDRDLSMRMFGCYFSIV
ncbi:uncharacterized protein N7479_010580 [Penicillium vulpinum]|uniref:Zn(2)-C6 fungal-type domain-containing protein n=1 Tax=Penicillium vulpinum TaxID=29845 RepID=A0A1V6SA29_9EURO|nr:uncharacterized protein N7479_010580 [Penicillium vulpinum]KAJ5952167.1 hypothetical protein N7479_010580 [Penicillium vulpinum]OQE10443.1 hypothetical protein PENVUL_c004G07227 [Penicillium vulpinum]